ncbi:MAG: ATP-binding protein [Actinomycetota bacterium]|nr:ATP-binding protein [Actinomycetota bacterium]
MQRKAKVCLELDSRPGCVTLVRAMLAASADTLGFEPELLDDLKTAVSEACNNVVVHAYNGEPGPLFVLLDVQEATVGVTVRDHGRGFQQVISSEERMGVGLAVISALSDRVEVLGGKGGGTEVRMEFASTGAESSLAPSEALPSPGDPAAGNLAGEISVTLVPVALLAGVMGRMARALAASARFSFDRFSDIYLIADAIAAHAERSAGANWIGFALGASDGKLELRVGPLRTGSGARLEQETAPARPRSPLRILVDQLVIEPGDGSETLLVVLADRRPDAFDEPEPEATGEPEATDEPEAGTSLV